MMDRVPARVIIREVGPRDGLQSETAILATEQKIQLVEGLAETGLSYIQVTSFSRPDRFPQHADGAQVMAGIKRRPGVCYAAYVPNKKGFERAREAGADGINMSVAASETAHRRNVGRSSAETLEEIAEVAAQCKAVGMVIGVTISNSFGCSIEGRIPKERVLQLGSAVADFGVDYLALGDTTGTGNPRQVHDMFHSLRERVSGPVIAAHFHDSRGSGLANVLAALMAGCQCFDGSVGGLGHTHYLPDGDHNVITEDVVCMLHEMGVETGVDLKLLIACAHMGLGYFGRTPQGGVAAVGPPKWDG